MQWLRSSSSRRGARTCMLARESEVVVTATGSGQIGIQGVKRCKSPWACEVCSPAVGETRAGELDQMMAGWLRQGGSLVFVTATLRHHLGDDLETLMDQLQEAWSRVWRWEAPRFGTGENTAGMLLNGEYGPLRPLRAKTWKGKPSRVRPEWYGGQARAIEVTEGGNGWHPHIHAAVFLEPGCSPRGAERAVRRLGLRWQESVELMGGTTVIRPVRDRKTRKLSIPGWDVRPITSAGEAAKYLTKIQGGWGAGLELARLDLKSARVAGNRKPFDLLHDAMDGDARAQALWATYERVTAARQRIVVSPGLAARCGVELLEDDDDELVAGILDGPGVIGAAIPGRHWRGLWARGEAAELAAVLSALGRGEPGAIQRWRWPAQWIARWSALSVDLLAA